MTLRKGILSRSQISKESFDEPTVTEDHSAVDESIAKPFLANGGEDDVVHLEETLVDDEDSITALTNAYSEVADVITESFDEGGLSMEAAQILNIFSKHHNVPVRAAVSTESYGTSGLFESRVALEGIKEVLAQWWVRLQAWLKAARQKLSEWGVELLVKVNDLKAKGTALKEKASNAQPGSGEIDFPRKHLLKIDDSYPSVPQAFAALTDFAKVAYVESIEAGYDNAKRVGGILSEFQLSGEQSLNGLVQKFQANANVPAEAYGRFLKNKITDQTVMQKLLAGNEGLNAYVLSSDKFLGNAQLVAGIVSVVITNNPVEDLKNFGKAIKFSELKLLDENTDNGKWSAGHQDPDDSSKLPRISPSEVSNIADNLVTMGDALAGCKEILQVKKSADAIIDQAGNHVQALNINEQVEGGAAIASTLRELVSSMSAQVQSPTMAVTMWLLTMSNAVGQYANLCLMHEAGPESQHVAQ